MYVDGTNGKGRTAMEEKREERDNSTLLVGDRAFAERRGLHTY